MRSHGRPVCDEWDTTTMGDQWDARESPWEPMSEPWESAEVHASPREAYGQTTKDPWISTGADSRPV